MKVSYLLLGYNRPQDTEECINSIIENSEFEYQIIYLCNGGSDDGEAYDLYKRGLIDKLILNRENKGCGFGTTDLFRACNTRYGFYVQVDQRLAKKITQSMVDAYIEQCQQGNVVIDLSGIGRGTYTERAHFVDVQWYNAVPDKPNGGPGPYDYLLWNEEYMTNYLKKCGNPVLSLPPLFLDVGKTSVRENPDGSVWEIRTDTKELMMLSPPSEKYDRFPNFTDEEWDQVINDGYWEDWRIPKKDKEHSFKHWNHENT